MRLVMFIPGVQDQFTVRNSGNVTDHNAGLTERMALNRGSKIEGKVQHHFVNFKNSQEAVNRSERAQRKRKGFVCHSFTDGLLLCRQTSDACPALCGDAAPRAQQADAVRGRGAQREGAPRSGRTEDVPSARRPAGADRGVAAGNHRVWRGLLNPRWTH